MISDEPINTDEPLSTFPFSFMSYLRTYLVAFSYISEKNFNVSS